MMSAISNFYGSGYNTQTSSDPLAAYTQQFSSTDPLTAFNELEGPNPTLGGVDVNSLLSGTGMNVSQLMNQGMDSSNYSALMGVDNMMNPQTLGLTNTSSLLGSGLGSTSGSQSMTPQDMIGTCMEMMGMMLQMMMGQGNSSGSSAMNVLGDTGSSTTSTGSNITSNPLTSPIYSYYNQYDPSTDNL